MKIAVKNLVSLSKLASLTLLFLVAQSALAAQELKVGFIQGRGNDAQVEEKAFKNAKIEFEVIDKGDYKIDKLLTYDVIAVGVVAYDKNEPLKENFKLVNQYVEAGGYLVTVDFQQDATWKKEFLPHPLQLLDPDLDDNVKDALGELPMQSARIVYAKDGDGTAHIDSYEAAENSLYNAIKNTRSLGITDSVKKDGKVTFRELICVVEN